MTEVQARIDRLLELKADPSTRAQMAYVDEIATEMARYCNTQEHTYAAAELLDIAITMLAWERLQNASRPATGSIRTLGIGRRKHNTPQEGAGGRLSAETGPARMSAHPSADSHTGGDAA